MDKFVGVVYSKYMSKQGKVYADVLIGDRLVNCGVDKRFDGNFNVADEVVVKHVKTDKYDFCVISGGGSIDA